MTTSEVVIPKLQHLKNSDKLQALSNVQRTFGTGHSWKAYLRGDELAYALMWTALCYTLVCFCYYMKE